jgi:transmembrane sensor
MSTQPAAKLSASQQQALDWLARLRDNECSETEKQAFSNWLTLTPENEAAYKQVQQFWEQTGDLQEMLGKRIKTARTYVKSSQAGKRRRSSIIILAVISIGLASSRPELVLKLASKQYQTEKGRQIHINLSDGSSIDINTDSEIRVADFLGWRKAWLERGEAWFNIRHNAAQTFEVFAGQGWIRDIGTQFMIMTDQNSTLVAVAEGEVAISTAKLANQKLGANQQTSFDSAGQISNTNDSDVNALSAWRQGLLIFKSQSLPEILKQLARYHQVEFDVTDSKLQSITYSGRFSISDLDECLKTLSSGLNVKITQLQPNRFLIRAAK